MAYLDIIPLSDAKVYLRIDDDLTEDDNQITRMINASLSYIERYTNVILYDRDKEYRLINGCVRVYDYPVNSEVTPDLEVENKTLYNNYSLGTTNDLIELNVGFVNVADIPQELIEVAYEIIELMYYEKETNKSHLNSLSSLSKMILDQNKRFIL